jgi:hypothetical protein
MAKRNLQELYQEGMMIHKELSNYPFFLDSLMNIAKTNGKILTVQYLSTTTLFPCIQHVPWIRDVLMC